MKKAKKLLVTLLVLTFVLSIMSTGFAATTSFSDVKDANVADAVTRLSALDILNGYPDGTFKPDNQITRAEFAKIIVSAVGVGKAAEYAKGTTQFKDVPSDYWASGYIKVASDMKIVNGRGNGVFDPNANVTYAEAITMIVRALGYEPKAQALGGYPGGYLAIAAEKDITKNVNVVNTLAATRGDVAKMVNNALDVNLMEQTGYGTNTIFEEVDKTLLTSKLSVDELVGVVTAIPKVDNTLDKDEITLEVTEKNGSELKTAETDDYTVLSDIDTASLFGLKVKAWAKDDKIFFVSVETKDKDTYRDSIDTVNKDASNKVKSLYLYVADKTINVASDAKVYVNYKEAALDDLTANMYGTFVVTNNNISFINVFNYAGNGVVTAVDSSKETIEYFVNSATTKKIRLADYDAYTISDKNGKTLSLSDIKEDSVIYWWENTDDDELFITVVNENATGELTKVRPDKVYIDGNGYGVNANATASDNENDKIVKFLSGGELSDAVVNLTKENVKVLFDINGDVRHISGAAEATSGTMYGIAMDAYRNGTEYDLKVFNEQGEKVVYPVDKKADWQPLADYFASYTAFVPVQFELNSDGKIKEGTLKKVSDLVDTHDITLASDGFNKDNDYITDGVNKYYIDSTIIMKYDKDDDKDPKLVNWNDIEDKTPTGAKAYVVGKSGKAADAVIFYDNFTSISDDTLYGIVSDKPYYDGNDWLVQINTAGEGKVEYIISSRTAVAKGDILSFTANTDNEITVLSKTSQASYKSVAETVYDVDSNYVSFVGDESTYYKLANDAVVYDVDEDGVLNHELDTSDIDVGNKVVVIKDDDIIKAVIIIDEMK
ncbi:MAG TPA: S-layer homology domain-containing protein [Thermoanaerobacterales bacterium]|nr:S-layer homology domain-containing protein [Thermoanaerobacterales bacterium]